jgi:SAM-dependent methyltransferase
MPQPPCHLRLDFSFPRADEDSPHISVRHADGDEFARIASKEEQPRLPLADASVASVDARDVLEHVRDEQAWLAEIARVVIPGGMLLLRVPLDNGLAWLDALNIYRYLGGVTGSGDDEPLETLPTGWHRHYRTADITGLIEDAGFGVDGIESEGMPLGEIGHLAGLIATSFTRDAEASQRRLFDLRERLHHRPLMPLPRSLASRVTIRATRAS